VSAALDRIRQDCDTIIVGGLSMGAVLALHIAAQRPNDMQGLALYAPTLWYDGWSTPWYRFIITICMMSRAGQFLLSRLYRFVEKEPYGIKDPYIRAVVIASLKSGDSTQAGILVTPGEAVRQLCLLVDVVRPELPSIKAPAFLVQAREDDLSSLKNSEYLQRHLGGLVDALILDDSYHIVTVDRQRQVTVDRTVAFVEGVARQTQALSPKAAAKPLPHALKTIPSKMRRPPEPAPFKPFLAYSQPVRA
jgi:carboxylesterase